MRPSILWFLLIINLSHFNESTSMMLSIYKVIELRDHVPNNFKAYAIKLPYKVTIWYVWSRFDTFGQDLIRLVKI